MTVVNADYSTAIEYMRASTAKGVPMSAEQTRFSLSVLQDAISRIDTARTTTQAQLAILQAFDGGSVLADVLTAIDTADTAISADAAAAPTYASNSRADQ